MSRNPKASATRASDYAGTIPSLSQLCSEAAEHVAKARIALFDESTDAEPALAHLDEAIFCLKQLLAYGRSRANASGANGSGTNGSRSGIRSA